MARPTKRSRSSNRQFRKRVPADVLNVARGQRISFSLPKTHLDDERILVSATVGNEISFSLRTGDISLAKLRHSAALEQFERACAAYRNGPRRLSNQDRHALAGVLYRDLAAAFEDEPVSAEWWRIVQGVTEDAANVPMPTLTRSIEGRKPLTIAGPNENRLQLLERHVGPFLDAILVREGVIADDGQRLELLEAFAKALIDVAKKLKRNAEGDYSPDACAHRFPKWDNNSPKPSQSLASLTFDDLLARWEKESEKAASSKVSFRASVAALAAHLGHKDARQVTRADVIAWKDALIDKGLSAKTINDS
ncbi:hypothetical protein [Candidatus Filomicrobium marinum]|nr:hypothetical protein [Candidatus Filomicrobium marinum]